jgi:DNA-binding response OmpR family regulator
MRVLVADDEAAIRLVVRHALDGFDVLEAESGLAALEILQSTPVNALLLDVMMPGLSGFGVLSRIRADERLRGIPVIMLTAKAGEHDHVAAFKAGADAYLTKPFDIDEVARLVNHVVRLSPAERAEGRQLELGRAELLAQIETTFG